MKTPSEFNILLVEDNPDDVLLTRLAFEKSRFNENMFVVEDGEEALQFLKKQDGFSLSPKPHLILLDLNLPRLSGLQVLEFIKKDPLLLDIPVIVLTTSTYEADILKSYKSHANCYITKPVDLENFLAVVRFIEHFWFSVVTLPPGEE